MMISLNILVHFLIRALNKGHDDNEAIKRFITYHLEQHIREFPGQKIVLFFDMSDASISNLVNLFPGVSLIRFSLFKDYSLVKFIIACAQILYPGLVGTELWSILGIYILITCILAYILIYKMSFLLSGKVLMRR